MQPAHEGLQPYSHRPCVLNFAPSSSSGIVRHKSVLTFTLPHDRKNNSASTTAANFQDSQHHHIHPVPVMAVDGTTRLSAKRSRADSLDPLPAPAKRARGQVASDSIPKREHDTTDDISECTIYCASPMTTPCMSNTSSPSSPSSTTLCVRTTPKLFLPDEVLVSVLRFVRSASALARLRAVCKRWRSVIDANAAVWRNASFHGAVFSRPVIAAPSPVITDGDGAHAPCRGSAHGRVALTLGPRAGRASVALAADAGNEWAQFLHTAIFIGEPLRAITVPQPDATFLVGGMRRTQTRSHPPWQGDGNGRRSLRRGRQRSGSWVVVHAARNIASPGGMVEQSVNLLPRGAVVGMIHVRRAQAVKISGGLTVGEQSVWAWEIDRHVKLVRPMRCAGFVGLWTMSEYMTEFFVRALHSQ